MMEFLLKNKIIFIGSFNLPKDGNYGGVYIASTTLRDKLNTLGYSIFELDTTLKNIRAINNSERVFSLILRNFKFILGILINIRAKYLFVFLSGGNSYIDKFLAIFLARLLGKSIIIFPVSGHVIQSYENRFLRVFINLTMLLSTKVICQSLFWHSFFKFNGTNPEKLLVIENWVTKSTIAESSSLNFTDFNNHSEEFKMIFASRIEVDKGVLAILDLAEDLIGKFGFRIDVFGSGTFENKFQDQIKARSLENYVSFKGWLDKKEMLQTINQYKLALFFSKTEGYPNALLDYIFAKIPVVASDIPMVKAVGNANMTYSNLNDRVDTLSKIEWCYNNYDVISNNAKKLYQIKIKENNIDYVVQKLVNNI